eukprot:Skav204614  [mRNA]  locus=scaffold1712:98962:110656:+ [translate_table: standard]
MSLAFTQFASFWWAQDDSLSKAKNSADEKEHERKVEFLRGAKFEADDRYQQLQVELQQARNSVNAQALQLESQFRDSQMQHLQAVDQARGDAEAAQRRAKLAEAQLQTAQATADHFSAKYHELEARDMKGSVRVFCRFRPLAKREEDLGDSPVLHKVFGGESPQEEVFGDCRLVVLSDGLKGGTLSIGEDLVRSVVDGYNVTIFAYGQTGAGKFLGSKSLV